MSRMSKTLWHTVVCRLLLLSVLAGIGSTAQAWWQADWAYRKQITLDGTANAAALSAEVENVPVLIRLHEGVFSFSDAMPDGADLRFVAADDKTPLKFHIERFDAVFNMAQIWVQVPRIDAQLPVQVWMYYGNPKATPVNELPAASYDASQMLIYHFAETQTAPQDSTLNGLHAAAPVAINESGLIGNSARFDGSSVVSIPASPVLTFLPTSEMTLSMWIKPAVAGSTAILFAQRDPSGGALLVGLNAGVPYVAVSSVESVLNTSSPTPAIDGTRWHRLAVVANASTVRLFVDGNEAASLERTLPALSGVATLGGDLDRNGAVVRGFVGEMDEVSVAGIARSPAWIALEAGNQGGLDTLVVFGVDEEQASASTGYFMVILDSVTFDGWVVIVLCIVMMFVSWWVMAVKGMQVARVGKANEVFLDAYREAGGDISRLHRALLPQGKADLGLDQESRALAAASPIVRMFNEGIHELQQRIDREEKSRAARGDDRRDTTQALLTEQSIEAIRSSLNAVFVREQQKLSSQMVLLTIAISGGPFLGLLGTVVGVMITFAAIAASGDVNVNSIAPGISAALAATVAGLGVAIPALFGYNYLTVRIKECGVEMQVFVDVFVTRIAENYNDPQALHAMADE